MPACATVASAGKARPAKTNRADCDGFTRTLAASCKRAANCCIVSVSSASRSKPIVSPFRNPYNGIGMSLYVLQRCNRDILTSYLYCHG